MKVRDVMKLLERDGGKVTVPGHPSIEVPAGTLTSILKQAGLKK
jgi:predicted RNA binding protein YcfA (HicA-like mRNA interferase family)